MSSPRNVLPRSPGFLMGSVGPVAMTQELSRSASGSSSNQISPFSHPGLLRRRSTDTSGGLDYYWSSLAGAGPNSSSSSLAISPSPSLAFGSSPITGGLPPRSRSQLSLSSLRQVDAGPQAQAQLQSPSQTQAQAQVQSRSRSQSQAEMQAQAQGQPRTPLSADAAGPSNRRIHVVSYPSTDSVPIASGRSYSSSGVDGDREGDSESSSYSPSEGPLSKSFDWSSFGENPSPRGYGGFLGSHEGEAERPLLDLSEDAEYSRITSGYGDRYNEARGSVASGSTFQADEADGPQHKTPMPPAWQERSDLRAPPRFTHYSSASPGHQNQNQNQTTNQQTTPTRSSASASSHSHYTPTSGRLAFVAPADVSRSSLDALEREVDDTDSSRMAVTVLDKINSAPQSAPPWQGEFGLEFEDDEDEGEETLKGRNRRTLPAAATSSEAKVKTGSSPDKKDKTSDKASVSGGSGTESRQSPVKSPELPPRSSLRGQTLPGADSDHLVGRQTKPLTISPRLPSNGLPTIINTQYTPDPSPRRAGHEHHQHEPRRPSRSPDRMTPVMSSSATINDLTEMLGGAIDAIGLIDSRDTPPPTVIEPGTEDKPDLSQPASTSASASTSTSALALAPPAEVSVSVPDQRMGPPASLPSRGASLPTPTTSDSNQNPNLAMPPPLASARSSRLDLLQKASSSISLRQATRTPPTIANIAPRPWPAAMLYGNIRNMKNAGDRAKAYARAINELARAETGLKEWCIASDAQARRSAPRPTAKASTQFSLGLRSESMLSPHSHSLSVPEPSRPHSRNVSSSSEFPMRADSYTAREISQRGIDPDDQPTSLPPLPYPQLQPQFQASGISSSMGLGVGMGMKHSPSMQSVASSVASKRSHERSFWGMRKGKKENISVLGPAASASGSATKKDVRGLAISSPSLGTAGGSTSPQRVAEGGLAAPRVQLSVSAPMGPRGPRMGSFTPPPSNNTYPERASFEQQQPGRASLDTSLSRITHTAQPARGSLDALRPSPAPAPAPSPAPGQGQVGKGSPLGAARDEELRSMADVLPHVEKGVLRAYLGRYGERMIAISAYLEDEQRGTVLRV